MPLRFLLAFVLLFAAPQDQPAAPTDPFAALVTSLEKAIVAGDRIGIRAAGASMNILDDFALALTMPPPQQIVIRERDRTALPAGGHRMLVEVFWQRGIEGRLSTWTLDVVEEEGELRVRGVTRITHVTGLYRLSLDTTKQFDVKNLTVEAPDLALHMRSGTAFVSNTYEGTTAVVLLGKGEMRFTPKEAAERTQVRLYSGREALITSFDVAFVRVRPEDFALRFPAAALVERIPDQDDVRRASRLFAGAIGRTLQINLSDLSPDKWSITPQAGDMIAEIGTDRFGTLTYTRSRNDAEDVTLFDRRRRRNISVYASDEKLASRGRFYSEDNLVDYDIIAYDVNVAITPERERIEGTANLRLRIRSPSTSTLNLRLAESLKVAGVYSEGFGRLLHLRVVNQNSLIVSLPGTMIEGTELVLRINYGGQLPPQELEREAVTVTQDTLDFASIPAEPRHVYSNRSYWYPQSVVSDYATARLSISVPSGYDVAASGLRVDPATLPAPLPDERGRDRHTFKSEWPIRYLACVISRFRDLGTIATTAKNVDGPVSINILANPRQSGRARGLGERAADIFSYYGSLLGEAPYPGFVLAFTERELPGGHSPAYFAIVDQPTQGLANWRNDPVNFDSYPDFFIAHEVAHQWWGQAIGWKNYHEQWLSEGFAQYFAALYAERRLSQNVVNNVFRRMRQTAMSHSDDGPIYLGYRLGHVQADPRVFRSILYNKGAMVLHMLRRTVGDEAFFRGLRDFYNEWKYKKAGTNDFQAAMEKASGRSLTRFFDGWVFNAALPTVHVSHTSDGKTATFRLEQHENPMDFPLTVRISYASGESETVILLASGSLAEHKIGLKDKIRRISVNEDHGALAEIR